MSIGGGRINGGVINGRRINGTALPDDIFAAGSGKLLTLNQAVGLEASGNILTLKQVVTSFQSGEGLIVEIRQEVKAAVAAGGELVRINQVVTDSGSIDPNPLSTIPHYIVRNGFYPMFTIGYFIWPDSQIHDEFTITANEGDGKQLIFTLLFRKSTAYGTINFEAFDGVTVTLDIWNIAGGVDRIFTGRINKVDVDVMKGSITCTCDDARRDKILSEYYYQTQFIGYYDEAVLGASSDTFDLLEKRLSTVPQSVDVDRYGNLQLSDILPNPIAPHLTFDDSIVYGNNSQKPPPRVEKLLRTRVVNTINISIDYQYQRRYHGTAHFDWDWATDTCEFLLEGESLAKRETIEAAADGTGWVMGSAGISFEEPPANGLYRCVGSDVPIPFTTVRVSGVSYIDVTDGSGNPVKGTDGTNLKKATGGVVEDSRNFLATAANWTMSYRWTQNIKETYNMTIAAPQSIVKYGVISQFEQTGIDDSGDDSGWEDYHTHKSFMTDKFEIEGAGSLLYYNNTPNRSKLFNAFYIAMNRARTTIIRAHRDNRVTFSLPLQTNIEMYQTIYLNTDRVQAYGKVVAFTHHCLIKNGDAHTEITIALCRSLGVGSDSVLTFPDIPTQEMPTPQFFSSMRSIYGVEPSANFKGFVGNKWKTQDDYTYGFRGSNTFKTSIQERFIVKAPDITSVYRDLLTLTSSGGYVMSLPNNTLVVNFL